MKALNLPKPTIILVVGLPGAGKSFFARKFAEAFNTPLVSIDEARMILTGTPSYEKEENEALRDITDIYIRELMKTERPFIVDGGFGSVIERLNLAKEARKAGYDTLLVWVQTDLTSAQWRSTHRSDKREGDRFNLSLQDPQFTKFSKAFQIPSPKENPVVISGKHTFPAQARVLLKRLISTKETRHEPTVPERPQAHAAPGRVIRID